MLTSYTSPSDREYYKVQRSIFWGLGYEALEAHCKRTIAEHQAALVVWRKLRRENKKRAALPAQPDKPMEGDLQ
jgi:hypothetical protein